MFGEFFTEMILEITLNQHRLLFHACYFWLFVA